MLRSMSEANCFIVLEHERGAVAAGEPVSVQLVRGAGMSPIHPSLALLAGAAKRKNWAGLQKQLESALRNPAWLRPEHRVGDPTGYMRHLLYVDPHGDFVMTAITWLPGQVSPRHGHQVWCAFGVAEGEADRGAVRRRTCNR